MEWKRKGASDPELVGDSVKARYVNGWKGPRAGWQPGKVKGAMSE